MRIQGITFRRYSNVKGDAQASIHYLLHKTRPIWSPGNVHIQKTGETREHATLGDSARCSTFSEGHGTPFIPVILLKVGNLFHENKCLDFPIRDVEKHEMSTGIPGNSVSHHHRVTSR